MPISFAPVTAANWNQAAALSVHPDQEAFVRSNLWSIAESRYHPWLSCLLVMHGDEPVGFLLHGRHADRRAHVLLRFMIDRQHQRRGYGRAALTAFLERVRREDPFASSVELSVEPENAAAIALYTSLGFQPTDERRDTEIVYRLPLTTRG